MAVQKNILANIIGRIWNIISIYLFIPLYIRFLGVESYGVISFYTLLLTLMAFADVGLSATLNREFAKVQDDPFYKQNLLRTFEYVYLGISIFIICLIFFTAPFIVKNFVKAETIPFTDLVRHIRIMGVIIAFYLTSTLYNGGLIGLQKQVLSNVLMIIYGVVRSGLVIIPLIWVRSLDFYFLWQLGAVIIYLITLRYYDTRLVFYSSPVKADYSYFKNLWKYALGMMLMAIIYSANTQIDKLFISNLLSLKSFTYYSLAGMIGQSVLLIATPIGIAIFPELTRLITLGNVDNAKKFFHKFSFLIASITSSIATVLIFYRYDYTLLWTKDSIISSAISYPTVLIVLGAMFMAIQLCPYYLALANGHTRTNVIMGITSIICVIPALYLLIPKYGLSGAALPWLVTNFINTILLGYIVIKKFLKGEFYKWCLYDSILPVFISFIIGIPLYFFMSFLPKGIFTIIYGLVIITVICIVNGFIFIKRYPDVLNHPFISRLKKIK